MTRIKYDTNLMGYMSLFESLTGTKLKDCISNDILLFVVQENQIGKAIGKGGANVRKIESALRKKIKLVEFSPDAKQFIANMVYPLQVGNIEEKENIITVKGQDTKTRGLLIGRDSKNLIHLTSVVKRYFNVSEIKVV